MNDHDREALLRFANYNLLLYRDGTLRHKLILLQRFADFVRVPLAEVDTPLFDRWLSVVGSHRPATTTRHYARAVSDFYRFLDHESEGRIRNPVPPDPYPHTQRTRRTWP